MSHYYDFDSSINSSPRLIECEILGNKIHLYSDNGVFSKAKLDEGSKLLIETLLPLNLAKTVLDVGAGYGPIGLILALYQKDINVTLVDINPRAVELCLKNSQYLNISHRVTCLQSDIYSEIEGPYDSIVSNPPIRAGKKVTYAIYEGAYKHLISGGSFYFVIRKAQGASSASKYVKEIFGNITLLAKKKGYFIYQARKN